MSTLNSKPNIDGILVQLPLPGHLSTRDILKHVSPEKDVDGFHPVNMGTLSRLGEEVRQDKETPFDTFALHNAPCTPLGCMELLDRSNIDIAGRHAVVIGRSNIVGFPMSTMLLHRDATVTICHSKTRNLKEICRTADILIAACGRPRLVKKDWVKEGAAVIDVGINYILNEDGSFKLVGDVDFHSVSKVAGVISPVPGGVGPMTVAMLMRNTLENSKRRQLGRRKRRSDDDGDDDGDGDGEETEE